MRDLYPPRTPNSMPFPNAALIVSESTFLGEAFDAAFLAGSAHAPAIASAAIAISAGFT